MNETHAHARTAHLRRNLTLCTAEGIVATPIVALIQPGNFIIAALLTITFPLPPERYGLIASLPFWCNFLQLPLTPWLDRHFRVQRVSVLFCLGQLICWAVFIAVLPFFPRDNIPLCGRWFVIFFFVMNAISAISGVSWTAWVQEWVPERVRGFYFGHRNRYMQVPTVLFLGIVGAVIDRLAGSVYAFQFLFLSAVLLRGVSITMQNRMVTVDLPGAVNASPLPWREQLNRVIADRSLRMYILFGAAWGFAVTGLAAFYPVFLYQVVGLSVISVGKLVILTGVGGGLSFSAWGQLTERYGNKPVMLFAMIAWQLSVYLWCFITPHNTWLLYFIWIWGGVMSAGFILGSFNIILKILPPEAKTMAISLNLGITSLFTALAPLLGGYVLTWALNLGLDPALVYHRLFVIPPTLALLSCFLLGKVHEPEAGRLEHVVGAMRNIRTLGGLFGLSFLVNYVFVKKKSNR